MPASELSPDFRSALEGIFASLATALGRKEFELRADPSAHKVRLQGETISIPIRYEVHWRRFYTIPTELVRDAAYHAKKSSSDHPDEADCEAFAEAFLRDNVLSAE